MFKELASALGEADAPLLVTGVPISTRPEYLVNPKLAVRGEGGGEGRGGGASQQLRGGQPQPGAEGGGGGGGRGGSS
jgi:hypothetical protein